MTYDNPGSASVGTSTTHTTVATRALDRVRWGPIVAGLFAALSTLAVLGVLGAAIGMSAYDRGDDPRNFGIGAGVWGAISALIAFFVGGWMAARTAAVRGSDNGLLNGSMVWVVAIPLLLYMIGGATMSAASKAVDAGAQAASNPSIANNANANNVADQARQASAQLSNDPATPERAERAANTGAKAAWGTLVSLLLGLGAAAAGGYTGARTSVRDVSEPTHVGTGRLAHA